MKYLPLRDFDTITNALNFSTPDSHIIGGCDVYTTKAAGGDKKLYKNIENSLESQYESLVRLSASLSPPAHGGGSGSGSEDDGKEGGGGSNSGGRSRSKRGRSVGLPEINLSRASPFGPLSQITARRTFAYLIATLNASHPDYDFSHILRPSDFRLERSVRAITRNIDSTLQNLRPSRQHSFSTMKNAYLAPPPLLSSSSGPGGLSGSGTEVWSPRMWILIDKEMRLQDCEKYTYVPDDDPFDGEEGALWSVHYFFFNKELKRVCYLYLRALSVISHSPVHAPTYLHHHHHAHHQRPGLVVVPSPRKAGSSVGVGEGAGKRASYWLGNKVLSDEIDTESYGEDDDDEEMVVAHQPGHRRDVDDDEEEGEVPYMDLDDLREDLAEGGGGYYSYDAEDVDDDGGDVVGRWGGAGGRMRDVSEEVVGELMEM